MGVGWGGWGVGGWGGGWGLGLGLGVGGGGVGVGVGVGGWGWGVGGRGVGAILHHFKSDQYSAFKIVSTRAKYHAIINRGIARDDRQWLCPSTDLFKCLYGWIYVMLLQVSHCLKLGSDECNCDMTAHNTIVHVVVFWLGQESINQHPYMGTNINWSELKPRMASLKISGLLLGERKQKTTSTAES